MTDFGRSPYAPSERVTTSTVVSPNDVNSLFRSSPMGQISTAIGDNFRGLNHRQAPSLIQINKDYYGLTFFTRPRLNLTDDNLRALRRLTPLLNTNEWSLQRYIRCLLDPVSNKKNVTSPLVDPQTAFIPILTNLLISLPGWPDPEMLYSTSAEGVMKEQFNIADGTTKIYRSVDLRANFRNVQGDPISALFEYWLEYMNGVYLGEIIPYPDSLIENEIDYQTRIYRLILDSTKRYVYRIAATGAGFPVSTPLGAAFNYEANGSGPINEGLQQVTVPFINSGVIYNDSILAWEFNKTTEIFNPTLADISPSFDEKSGKAVPNDQRSSVYQKIAIDEISLFNYRGYPRIDLGTYELEWFVSKEEYREILPLIKQNTK
jgi:hypothetical protein